MYCLLQYDKFHLRGCIDALLMELWRDPSCAASLTAAAQAGGPEGGLFADFVGAVLNDLMYLLKDSLQASRACSALLLVLRMTAAVTLPAHACGFHASNVFELSDQTYHFCPPPFAAASSAPLPACSAWRTSTPWRSARQTGRAGSWCRSGSARRSRWVGAAAGPGMPAWCLSCTCVCTLGWAFQACCNLPPTELQAHVSPLPCPAAALLPCRRPACPAAALLPCRRPVALPPPCLQAFYESQQSTTRGFMRMAVSTLTMLNRLVENAAVRAGFMQQAVAARAAAAVSGAGSGSVTIQQLVCNA